MARKPSKKTLTRFLLAAGLRLLVFLATMGIVLILTAGAVGMGAVWGLLTLGERDLTLNEKTMPFWPDWLMPIDLLHDWSHLYLAASIALIFLVLPLILALLEKTVLASASEGNRWIRRS